MHSNMKNNLRAGLMRVDNAIGGFVNELKAAPSIFNKVVILSQSEFGRTLDSNGVGSDHAWSGNHFIIGGKLKGGQIFNNYTQTMKVQGNPRDVRRGILIPAYPWESITKPIAQWMGVSDDNLGNVFTNLGNFPDEVINDVSDVFKA